MACQERSSICKLVWSGEAHRAAAAAAAAALGQVCVLEDALEQMVRHLTRLTVSVPGACCRNLSLQRM